MPETHTDDATSHARQSTLLHLFGDHENTGTSSVDGRSSDLTGMDPEEAMAAIARKQGVYQPLVGALEQSPREHSLLKHCADVVDHFRGVKSLRQIRILDIGCNAGFVSLELSKKIPNVVGIDLDPEYISYCNSINGDSSARFYQGDGLALLLSNDDDAVNIDCVLLLNVLHQLILKEGLDAAQKVIASVVERVDVVFVELARKDEYNTHPDVERLPERPEDVLDLCQGVQITSLPGHPRVAYKLERKQFSTKALRFPSKRVMFSENLNPAIARKYYVGEKELLKVYRFTSVEEEARFDAERAALETVSGRSFAPAVSGSSRTSFYGAIAMKLIDGMPLTEFIMKTTARHKRLPLIPRILTLARELRSCGIYQNDFSSHNIFVLPAGDVQLIDYDRAAFQPTIDHIGFFLWIMHDLIVGRNDAYAAESFSSLETPLGVERASSIYYPNIDVRAVPANLRSLVFAAKSAPTWDAFLEVAASKGG